MIGKDRKAAVTTYFRNGRIYL